MSSVNVSVKAKCNGRVINKSTSKITEYCGCLISAIEIHSYIWTLKIECFRNEVTNFVSQAHSLLLQLHKERYRKKKTFHLGGGIEENVILWAFKVKFL